MLKNMYKNLYNKTFGPRLEAVKLDGGKAWEVLECKISSYILLSSPKSNP